MWSMSWTCILSIHTQYMLHNLIVEVFLSVDLFAFILLHFKVFGYSNELKLTEHNFDVLHTKTLTPFTVELQQRVIYY